MPFSMARNTKSSFNPVQRYITQQCTKVQSHLFCWSHCFFLSSAIPPKDVNKKFLKISFLSRKTKFWLLLLFFFFCSDCFMCQLSSIVFPLSKPVRERNKWLRYINLIWFRLLICIIRYIFKLRKSILPWIGTYNERRCLT